MLSICLHAIHVDDALQVAGIPPRTLADCFSINLSGAARDDRFGPSRNDHLGGSVRDDRFGPARDDHFGHGPPRDHMVNVSSARDPRMGPAASDVRAGRPRGVLWDQEVVKRTLQASVLADALGFGKPRRV